MKRVIFTFSAIIILVICGCQKGKETEKEVAVAKKYAKYRVSVYKEKEMKTWLATLEKAEDVSLLSEEDYRDNKSKGGLKDISKIKLADDSIGYTESRHLADKPVVFTADTKVFVRPTTGSKIYATIPKGELGFIIEEKGLWVQVYIGKINGKNVTQQWVEGNFTSDTKIVLQAKELASALTSFNGNDPEKKSQAKKILENFSNGNSVIAEIAKEKLNESNKDDTMNTEEPAMEEGSDTDIE